MSKEIDHERTDNAVCPYCGHEDYDSWELGYRNRGGETGDDETGNVECGKCDKTYIWIRHVSVDYSTKKIEDSK